VSLAASGYTYYSTNKFINQSTKTQGIVIDLVGSRSSRIRTGTSRSRNSTTYAPVVEFKTDSGDTIEFTSSTRTNPPSFSRGERVDVFYDPWSPNNAKIDGFFSLWGSSLILGFVGLPFAVIGVGWFARLSHRRKLKNQLRMSGLPITAEITGVSKNSRFKLNGRRPSRVTAKWLDNRTSKVHTFNSDLIWYDPTEYMEKNEVTVYIDREDSKKYFMDISFLPNSDIS